ncbi:ferric reductase like transmembrane component-domain-containing protein [Bisporella sp. PMI_857]|nr:ferric reductase like transmembrane component-domain-containing protein [Bisporella sp. PMI_857]
MLLYFIAFAGCISLTFARTTPPDSFCFGASQQIIRTVKFSVSDPNQGWIAQSCSNELAIESLYLTLKLHCTEDEQNRGLVTLNQTCSNQADTPLPPFSLIDKYTDEDISRLHHLEPQELQSGVAFNEVIIPSERLFMLAFKTLDAAYFETEIHELYGFVMYYFWVVVVLIGASVRFLGFCLSVIQSKSQWQPIPGSANPESETSAIKRKGNILTFMHTQIKRYVTVPATFGYIHAQNIWWCTIPTRIQSLTIAAFIIINVVLCSISYRVFKDNQYWPDISTQVWRYLADRTGVISTANLALIWVFGIRNSSLLWLTGWDFATYNNFHRWVARVATVQAVIHSVAYTVLIFGKESFKDGWETYVAYLYMRWFLVGVAATIFMVAICCFSVYGLRRNFYEIFLILHLVLSGLVIVTMFGHVEIFNGEYDGYMWPCVFIWIFDRILRIARILLFNFRFWNTKALVIYDPTSNIIRLIVPYSTSFIKPRPGTFYYITSLSEFKVWESHPFTLGYSTSEREPSQKLHSQSRALSHGTMSPPQQDVLPIDRPTTASSSRSFELQSLLPSSTTVPPQSMVFIIRPYDGFTARLRDAAILHATTLRLLVDGPYGETQPFHKYENVLFVVGGTGIAVPLSYLDALLSPSSNATSLRIVWAVREHKLLTDAIANDFRGALENDNEKFELAAYITQAEEADKDEVEGVRVYHGRPDIREQVEEAARNAGGRSLAVVACGPGPMADQTRRAVVDMLGNGYGKLEYFEESFNW